THLSVASINCCFYSNRPPQLLESPLERKRCGATINRPAHKTENICFAICCHKLRVHKRSRKPKKMPRSSYSQLDEVIKQNCIKKINERWEIKTQSDQDHDEMVKVIQYQLQ